MEYPIPSLTQMVFPVPVCPDSLDREEPPRPGALQSWNDGLVYSTVQSFRQS